MATQSIGHVEPAEGPTKELQSHVPEDALAQNGDHNEPAESIPQAMESSEFKGTTQQNGHQAEPTTQNGDHSEANKTSEHVFPSSLPLATSAQNGDHAKSTGAYGHNNPSLVVTADHNIKMEEAPVLEPGPHDVLLHIKTTGICGSDIHFWKRGAIGTCVVEGDCILGHEASGIVLRCGDNVKTIKPGDRVAVEPGVPCGECYLCVNGRYNLCEDVLFAGVWPANGTIQRFKVHPAKWVHKLPDNISYAEGALLEPLSVVMHGINSSRLHIGRGALICGAGPIGLIALAAARASGAHPLVITDLEPKRLAFAKQFIPSCKTYQVSLQLDAEANAKEIRKLYDQGEYHAPDVALECTGVESSVCTACFTVRRGGEVMVIGVGKSIMNNLPFMHLSLAEIQLKFINRYHDTWPAGINAFNGGVLDLKPLVTHNYPLEQAIDAMHLCSDLSKGSVKVQIVDDIDITI